MTATTTKTSLVRTFNWSAIDLGVAFGVLPPANDEEKIKALSREELIDICDCMAEHTIRDRRWVCRSVLGIISLDNDITVSELESDFYVIARMDEASCYTLRMVKRNGGVDFSTSASRGGQRRLQKNLEMQRKLATSGYMVVEGHISADYLYTGELYVIEHDLIEKLRQVGIVKDKGAARWEEIKRRLP